MYKKFNLIVDPDTQKQHEIISREGSILLKNYLKQMGGDLGKLPDQDPKFSCSFWLRFKENNPIKRKIDKMQNDEKNKINHNKRLIFLNYGIPRMIPLKMLVSKKTIKQFYSDLESCGGIDSLCSNQTNYHKLTKNIQKLTNCINEKKMIYHLKDKEHSSEIKNQSINKLAKELKCCKNIAALKYTKYGDLIKLMDHNTNYLADFTKNNISKYNLIAGYKENGERDIYFFPCREDSKKNQGLVVRLSEGVLLKTKSKLSEPDCQTNLTKSKIYLRILKSFNLNIHKIPRSHIKGENYLFKNYQDYRKYIDSFGLNRPVVKKEDHLVTLKFAKLKAFRKKLNPYKPVYAYQINQHFYSGYSDYLYHLIMEHIWPKLPNKIPRNCPSINGFDSKYGICMGLNNSSSNSIPISKSAPIDYSINKFKPYVSRDKQSKIWNDFKN